MRTFLLSVLLLFSPFAFAQLSRTFSLTSPDTALYRGAVYTQPEILITKVN